MNRWDKYDVSGNVEAQFADESEDVLVNKLGIKELEPLQLKEEEGLATAYEILFSEVRTDTVLTTQLVRHVHDRIFGELFEWAGRWRTVVISKPGAIWPPPQYLDAAMKSFETEILSKCESADLVSDDVFVEISAEVQGEFLAIHPFREGNARTIKLVNDLLAAQTNRPMLKYDQSDAGRDEYINAAKAAMAAQDYRPMQSIIRTALQQATG
ncbi:MAG: Fic family protein [Fuerstiella sp.]